jgi:formylglycine-generating enzyme required for sulfatase activity
MKTHEYGFLIPLRAAIFVPAALWTLSCDAYNFPLERFFIENTAAVWVEEAQPASEGVVIGDEGLICLDADKPGEKIIAIPLDNYADLVLDEDGLVSLREAPRKEIRPGHELEKDKLRIYLSGALEGDAFFVDITGKTAKEGRLLFEQELEIACVSFKTGLKSLSVGGNIIKPNEQGEYAAEVYSETVRIIATPVNSAATVTAAWEGGVTSVSGDGYNFFLDRVEPYTISLIVNAPHGVTESMYYTLRLTRSLSSNSITAFDLPGAWETNIDTPANTTTGTIRAFMPLGVSLENLSPAITLSDSQARVDPPSGQSRNFTDDVTYTVTGRDGAIRTYSVTVLNLPPYKMIDLTGGTVSESIGNVEGSSFINAGENPVTVSGFSIGETEIPYELWETVYNWATNAKRGTQVYDFANSGRQGGSDFDSSLTPKHPVTEISWRDAVVWCNAYSEAMGKTPVYYLQGTTDFTDTTKVLRYSEDNTLIPGNGKAENAAINPYADGFRLPTSTEWEYAARGGNPNAQPWYYTYAGSNTVDPVAVYKANATAPVKSKNANSMGLYDMSGNVWEWCQDIYSDSTNRVIRGGAWNTQEGERLCSVDGHYSEALLRILNRIGFRVAGP